MPRSLVLAIASILFATQGLVATQSSAAEPDLWPGLKEEIFGDRVIAENDGVIALFAPETAEDAALVLPAASVTFTVRLWPPSAKAAVV